MTALRQRMVEELQRRNYSPATIRGYVLAVKQFAEYFGKPPDRLGATQVQRFQWYLLQERKLTPGTVKMRMSALRFFFKKMLKRRDIHFDDLPFPKQQHPHIHYVVPGGGLSPDRTRWLSTPTNFFLPVKVL